jgi:hypothetical protein
LALRTNENTKDEWAKEEWERVGNDGDQAQHLIGHKKLPNAPSFMNLSE